jgi:radical SAM superfamily enzyme YgiQ (UPF0313 family)
MKRLFLVNASTERLPYPVPPIGLCLLASILRKDFQVRLFDGLAGEGKDLSREVVAFMPDYIGVSIRNIDDMVMDKPHYYVDQIFRDFILPLRSYPKASLILGGSGFSIFPGELMNRFEADYGIIGEAEVSFPMLLDKLRKGEDVTSIPGVITRKDNPAPVAYDAHFFDLKGLPFSEIDTHIDFLPYLGRGVYSIQTKRGCNHKCIYCTYPGIEGRHYRFRNPEDVAEEIRQALDRLGKVTVEFVDSTFNDPPGWAESICREIIKKRVKTSFRTMGINPAHTSRKLFSLMLEAGFSQIDCTPDSASREMLVNLGKNFTVEQLENTASLLREVNLPAMWFFTFGGPGETEKTMEETFRFIDERISENDMVHLTTCLRIYPGTPLHKIATKEKQVTKEDPLLEPRFYISGALGKKKIDHVISRAVKARPNWIPAGESSPSKEMLEEAMRIRSRDKLTEPMFRTLIRLRNKGFNR